MNGRERFWDDAYKGMKAVGNEYGASMVFLPRTKDPYKEEQELLAMGVLKKPTSINRLIAGVVGSNGGYRFDHNYCSQGYYIFLPKAMRAFIEGIQEGIDRNYEKGVEATKTVNKIRKNVLLRGLCWVFRIKLNYYPDDDPHYLPRTKKP